MPTDKPRVTFAISEDKLAELESYRYENKIKNQSQAILSLIDKGLSSLELEADGREKIPPAQPKPYRGEEHVSTERATSLLVSLGFIEEGRILSDDDFLFLSNVMGILDAWFKKSR